jgi:alanine dehydrogenase
MKIDPKTAQKLFPEECLLREMTYQSRLSIGIPKENKEIETRLGLTPEGVAIVVEEGHSVYVQRGAGESISYTDLQYSEAGAFIVDEAAEVFSTDIVLKIAPPTREELQLMKSSATIFSLLQLTNLSKECIELMMEKKLTAIAYELIKDHQKAFPVVNSLAEIEGISAIGVASELMTSQHGGKGLLLGGIAGIFPTEVLILGAGTVCTVAARIALAIGAEVRIFDYNINKLRQIKQQLGQHVFTSVIHPNALFKALASADAVIGNLRYINETERFMVSEDLVKTMKKGAVIIDLSIDQGGCFETSNCRKIINPIYEKHGVIHYCAPNISARVPRTASMALSNIIAPMLLEIGKSGSIKSEISENAGFRNGVYVYEGIPVNRLIAEYYGIKSNDIGLLIAGF